MHFPIPSQAATSGDSAKIFNIKYNYFCGYLRLYIAEKLAAIPCPDQVNVAAVILCPDTKTTFIGLLCLLYVLVKLKILAALVASKAAIINYRRMIYELKMDKWVYDNNGFSALHLRHRPASSELAP